MMVFILMSAFASNVRNGSEPILCISVYVTIDAMLNFGGGFDVDAKAKITGKFYSCLFIVLVVEWCTGLR